MADVSDLNVYELNDDQIAKDMTLAISQLDRLRNGEIDHEKRLQKIRLDNLQAFFGKKMQR